MSKYSDYTYLEYLFKTTEAWVYDNVLIYSNFIQLCLILLTLFLSWYLAPKIRRWREKLIDKNITIYRYIPLLQHKYRSLGSSLVLPTVWLLALSFLLLIGAALDTSYHLIKIAISLLAAWVIIHLSTGVLKNKALSKVIAIIVWTVAALNILNLIEPVANVLDSIALSIGELRISALTVIEGVCILIAFLWLALFISQLIEQQVKKSTDLTPSVKVLISKLIKITLIIIAIVTAISAVGIDLTAFAVFSGAIGVGIGFGLQKSIANLFSGMLLLMDKSIKPGDLITVGDTYGIVESLNARYASIRKLDGTEHLIPNENLINQDVINWTHSDQLVRPNLDIGVHYKSDVKKAIELCIEAAEEVERVLDNPEPECILNGFGNSSVDLILRFWINDPEKGVANIKSEILLNVWDKFHENDIEIPYPQRDIHIRSSVTDSKNDESSD